MFSSNKNCISQLGLLLTIFSTLCKDLQPILKLQTFYFLSEPGLYWAYFNMRDVNVSVFNTALSKNNIWEVKSKCIQADLHLSNLIIINSLTL